MGFISRLHEIERDVTGIAINKENKITIRRKGRGEGTANVTVNSFEEAIGRMRGFRWERGVLNVSLSTNTTGRFRHGVIELQSVDGVLETFNAYVSHQAVKKSACEGVMRAQDGALVSCGRVLGWGRMMVARTR